MDVRMKQVLTCNVIEMDNSELKLQADYNKFIP